MNTTWRVHAYEPFWMPQDTFDAVTGWLKVNRIHDKASGIHDVTVVTLPCGTQEIHYTQDGGKVAMAPLLVDPPAIPRPKVPHLTGMQRTLSKHHRVDAPTVVLGNCLVAEHAGVGPGAAMCWECSQDRVGAEVAFIPWPCPPAREAADRSGVELW